ncbi:winged helix-turn-helix transcriptional regulator [Salinibacterium soli]|uniref:Helix-turn-helix domain-containing protein n=1 Tax=Antiquaquibacter soli TaxID=3064523 RepID=A0ABT9BRP7_9MICO|nr:helix-turn-helix domain-containing protein [Protaetiibacter sp. WY-16]MDO7883625.1 helix-turn-helix domain-containing protein [Protaetiibacter sp. WY-16]
MAEYHQFCGLARALDLIGDRWNLLIVRELLIAERRHSELRSALPGVATNLLAERLQTLVTAGIVARREESGRKAVSYSLTPRGAELREPVLGLVRWGAATMSAGPRPDDAVQPQWVLLALEALLPSSGLEAEGTIHLRADGMDAAIHLHDGRASVSPSGPRRADALVAGPSAAILGLFARALPLAAARQRGLEIEDPAGLVRSLVS